VAGHRTVVTLDEDLLRQAREILGTSSIVDTVNQALREVVAMAARRRDAIAALEGSDIADEKVRTAAWR
jgi:Arc/MetJ family transcription regulator